MICKDKKDEHNQEKKKALSFTTIRGITFSTLTKNNIEKNKRDIDVQLTIENLQNTTNSEVDEEDD